MSQVLEKCIAAAIGGSVQLNNSYASVRTMEQFDTTAFKVKVTDVINGYYLTLYSEF